MRKNQELDGFVDADGDGFPVAEDCDDDDKSNLPGALNDAINETMIAMVRQMKKPLTPSNGS